ncbi:MAG: hypothetical protein RRC34_00500 [Lentisphaeria bacterium]|nr:hypothetical protein [Lentisphaeria bacterium]
MSKTLMILALAALAAGCETGFRGAGGGDGGQRDMDILRLRHIQQIAGLIEEYRQSTGHYPLARSGLVTQYVYIATDEQEKNIPPILSEKHVVTPCETLERELSRVLKRNIRLPKDPQAVATLRPNVYLYITRGKDFWLAVHLHSPCSLSKPVAKYHHMVEVSSKPWPPSKVWSLDTLMTHPDFVKEVKRPLHNPDAFPEQRELREN